jgi:hypothetical protein
MNKEGIKIKNELIEIYKRKIEEINKLYDEYINKTIFHYYIPYNQIFKKLKKYYIYAMIRILIL